MQNLPSPSLPDIIALAVVVFGIIRGMRRGLSGELAGLVALSVALVMGLVFYRQAGEWALDNTRLSESGAHALAFLVTVLASGAIMLALALLLRFLLKFAIEKKVDRAWGAVIGMVRSIIGVLIFFVAVNLWPHPYLNKVCGEESIIGSIVARFLPELKEKVEKTTQEDSAVKDKVERLIRGVEQ